MPDLTRLAYALRKHLDTCLSQECLGIRVGNCGKPLQLSDGCRIVLRDQRGERQRERRPRIVEEEKRTSHSLRGDNFGLEANQSSCLFQNKHTLGILNHRGRKGDRSRGRGAGGQRMLRKEWTRVRESEQWSVHRSRHVGGPAYVSTSCEQVV